MDLNPAGAPLLNDLWHVARFPPARHALRKEALTRIDPNPTGATSIQADVGFELERTAKRNRLFVRSERGGWEILTAMPGSDGTVTLQIARSVPASAVANPAFASFALNTLDRRLDHASRESAGPRQAREVWWALRETVAILYHQDTAAAYEHWRRVTRHQDDEVFSDFADSFRAMVDAIHEDDLDPWRWGYSEVQGGAPGLGRGRR